MPVSEDADFKAKVKNSESRKKPIEYTKMHLNENREDIRSFQLKTQ